MLKLTDYEKKMLNGEMGAFKQKALEKIIEYAKVLNAEELCEVTKATVYYGAHPYLDVIKSDDYNEVFSKMMLCSDDKIYEIGDFSDECFIQTCCSGCDYYCYEPINISKEVFEKNKKYLQITRPKGVNIVGSCTPYLSGWIPIRGEHFVSTESSNILMCNSVFGACGNADGLEASTWSAICGRTPKWGNHILENRYATHIFEIQCKSDTEYDWDIIGIILGKILPGNARPVVTGNFKHPNLNKLKRLFASLATTSGCEICHIVGCTAEAPTLEAALNGHTPLGTFAITQEMYDDALSTICDEGSEAVQMVVLGCPHYALDEIKKVADLLKNKKVNENVSLQVWTDLAIQKLADINGYTEIIENAGGHLLNSSCPLVCGRTIFDNVKTGFVTDGAKQAHYLHSDLKNIKIFYGTTEKCIDAAIKGWWD